jgi:hypothetical protein
LAGRSIFFGGVALVVVVVIVGVVVVVVVVVMRVVVVGVVEGIVISDIDFFLFCLGILTTTFGVGVCGVATFKKEEVGEREGKD